MLKKTLVIAFEVFLYCVVKGVLLKYYDKYFKQLFFLILKVKRISFNIIVKKLCIVL